MKMVFDIGDVGDENFFVIPASKMVRDCMHLLDEGVEQCAVREPFLLIRKRGELGKWLQGKNYRVSVRRTKQLWGDQRGENRYSLWLELADKKDALYFKLKWGGVP